jgi:hypothetical protein
MSTLREESRRDSRREEEWCERDELECFDEDELDLDDLEEDFSTGTSRMFRTRPVVGSVVEAVAGSWDTW